ncbi:MAG TPA: hypothetical protein VKA57_05015, partial [Solirubrobacteraceae bacterium]|nr:hypothetical protein [Solirubrobacteraceae bacterium]
MRRIAIALAAALFLAVGVGACGGTDDDDNADKAAGAPAAKADKLEPAEITLWVGFTQRELKVFKDAVKGFEEKNP